MNIFDSLELNICYDGGPGFGCSNDLTFDEALENYIDANTDSEIELAFGVASKLVINFDEAQRLYLVTSDEYDKKSLTILIEKSKTKEDLENLEVYFEFIHEHNLDEIYQSKIAEIKHKIAVENYDV